MKHNAPPHVLGLKGSDRCSILFTDRPTFSTTRILISCQFISSWYRHCNTDPGVDGTKITDSYPHCVYRPSLSSSRLSPGGSNRMDDIMVVFQMTRCILSHHRPSIQLRPRIDTSAYISRIYDWNRQERDKIFNCNSEEGLNGQI